MKLDINNVEFHLNLKKKIKAVFGSCKIFSGKYLFSGNAILGKENIFKCLVAL